MTKPNFVVVIPARFASTRLPGKPLVDIAGKPMVVWVVERARLSGAQAVWVATDHTDVLEACRRFGVDAMLTRADHQTGTDRLAEVAERLVLPDDQIVVNVQGDEPLIAPELIREVVIQLADHPQADISTAAHPIEDAAGIFNPNQVKVVCDKAGYALYFSRAPIPFARDTFTQSRTELPVGLPVLRHIGIYAYRASFLRTYGSLTPAPIEAFEALEQLRALWHGFRIAVGVTGHAPAAGVDTPQDLELVRQVFDQSKESS